MSRRVRAVTSLTRSRVRIAVVGAFALALGIASRRWPLGTPLWDDHLGDACYAAMIVVVLAFARPACARVRLALVAFAIGAAIELFQLTGLPAEWARAFRPLALVFGTTFAWADLVAQAVGIVLATMALGATSQSLASATPEI